MEGMDKTTTSLQMRLLHRQYSVAENMCSDFTDVSGSRTASKNTMSSSGAIPLTPFVRAAKEFDREAHLLE